MANYMVKWWKKWRNKDMDTTKLTREEALHRWNASKETKRKMVEKLETLVRNSCLERTGKEPIEIEVW